MSFIDPNGLVAYSGNNNPLIMNLSPLAVGTAHKDLQDIENCGSINQRRMQLDTEMALRGLAVASVFIPGPEELIIAVAFKRLFTGGKAARLVEETVPAGAADDGARSSANAARLRGQLAGDEIAGGHAFEKHVIQRGEFAGLGIRTREQFARHIENVVNNPSAYRQLSGGRTAFWDDVTGTVVIRNPRAADGGTAFRPTSGREYFDGLR